MFNRNYIIGVSWFLLSVCVCQLNDVLQKYLSSGIHPIQVTFLRFLFAVMSLLPIMCYKGKQSFYTARPFLHFLRGGFLFLAVVSWCFGLKFATMPLVVVIGFSMPVFLLILARIFLKEKISGLRWTVTLLTFLGILIAWNPFAEAVNLGVLVLIFAELFFASLDILNKKLATKETLLAMLFYTALFTLLFAAIPAFFLWHSLNFWEWCCSACLGIGANLLLLFLLKAFRHIDASVTANYRYFELVLAMLTGYFIFGELPSFSTLLSAAIIIPSTLILGFYESRQNNLKNRSTDSAKADICC